MHNALASQCIRSGILDGNDRFARWTGGEWVCERGSVECLLVPSVADRFLADMPPGWHVWPETNPRSDFESIGTNYRDYVHDCSPERVFGVRYDLALLRAPKSISGLIEIKRYWIITDLIKLARSLFYLGVKPQTVQSGDKKGVLLESVFFGAFIWHNPNASDVNVLPVEERYHNIQTDIKDWWQSATTGGGAPIQKQFEIVYGFCPPLEISFTSKTGTGSKGQWEAGAVCVCLSLDENP